jgi:hypothetical protein
LFIETPASENLEVLRAIHSFLELWALGVFLGVVGCDLVLRFTENLKGLEWTVAWSSVNRTVKFFGRSLSIKVPAYSDHIDLKSVLKTLSLVGFGLAIGMEFLAQPYSDRIDELSAKEETGSRKQIARALVQAGNANREAGMARTEAANTALRAGTLEKEAAKLRLEADTLEESRLNTERRFIELLPRSQLIYIAEDEMQKAILPFKGQKVEVPDCRGRIGDAETEYLRAAILSELTKAGWIVTAIAGNRCIGGTGVMVILANRPLRAILPAADTLALLLMKILLPTVYPRSSEFVKTRERCLRNPTTQECIALGPLASQAMLDEPPIAADTIIVGVYAHPILKDAASTKKPKKP